MAKESPVTFLRLPEEIRKKAKAIAHLEERPLANMLRVLIQEAIAARAERQNGN